MKRLVIACAVVFSFLGSGEAQESRKSREILITGEVIDPKCYFTQAVGAGQGKEHAECALQCARNGVPLAILEEKTDLVYFTAKARGMGGANDMLIPFIGEQVSVKGKLVERGGTRLLLIETVEKAK